MGKYSVLVLCGLLVSSLFPSMTSAADADEITNVDIITNQDASHFQPDQIALERSLHAGAPVAGRLHMTPVPAKSPYGMAAFSGDPKDVFIADRSDGSVWEMNVDSGKVLNHFHPSTQPSKNLEAIAADDQGSLYVYYNGNGTIQRLSKTGQVEASYQGPTMYGGSLAYHGGHLYLMTDRGVIYEMNPANGNVVNKITLLQPNGNPFGMNGTLTLFWDGAYWNVAAIQDHWKLYRYDSNWRFHEKRDLSQWNITGCVYDGQDYLVMNNDDDRVFTIRLVDDTPGSVNDASTSDYQYIGNLLTTANASADLPTYPDKNLELLYNTNHVVSTDSLMPYAAYLDPSGNIAGDMFDSFVFLPDKTVFDAQFYEKTDPSDWKTYITRTVHDMQALDADWARKNAKLGETGRARVYLAVPYPDPADSLATREQVLQQYMDEANQAVRSAGLSHLNFAGFYWLSEESNYADSLTVYFNQYAHKLGYQTVWIPDALAGDERSNYEASDYSALGFDEVFQQPNYYFKASYAPNLNRFFNAAWTGFQYGKGVEMELDQKLESDPSYRDLFNAYLHYGLVEGFLGASKAWYEDWAIGDLYQSGDPLYPTIHQALQNTYREPGVDVVKPADGALTSSLDVALPLGAKLRVDVLTRRPYAIKKVIVHTSAPGTPVTYIGTLRTDEEVVLRNGQLVKQEIGGSSDGLRIGFNVPVDDPVQITVVPADGSPFTDVDNSNPAYAAIIALSDEDIINGSLQGSNLIFHPAGKITRAEFATMLTAAYHLTGNERTPFLDANGAWYTPYVDAVYTHHFMSGYDAQHFGPDDPISQEQVAAILVRILNNEGKQVSTDGVAIRNQQSIDTWALSDVLEGKPLGLYSDTFGSTPFDPLAPASRADVAQVLYNALKC